MLNRWLQTYWRSEQGRTRLFKAAVIATNAMTALGAIVILYLLLRP